MRRVESGGRDGQKKKKTGEGGRMRRIENGGRDGQKKRRLGRGEG